MDIFHIPSPDLALKSSTATWRKDQGGLRENPLLKKLTTTPTTLQGLLNLAFIYFFPYVEYTLTKIM